MPAPETILMICTRFGTSDTTRYLTNELADALAADGAKVLVAVIQWDAEPGSPPRLQRFESGVETLFLAPRQFNGAGKLIAKASKWVGSSWFAVRQIKKHFGTQKIDLLVAFSPLVVSGFALRWAKKHYRCRSYAYLTDFFPFHHRAAGLLPGGPVFALSKRLESELLRRFDVVGCMSPRGADYVREHYRLEPRQKVHVLPLWGETNLVPSPDCAAVRRRYGLPVDRRIAIFGGQITEGRGIEDLIEVARRASEVRPDLLFLIVGRGRLQHLLAAYVAEGRGNLMHLDAIGRDDYLQLVAACDLGIVSTLASTNVPTFPSKTLDYLRAGVPIAASVEDTTDYADFVRDNGFGVAVAAGRPAEFLTAIQGALDDDAAMRAMADAGRRALFEHFDVRKACSRLRQAAA